MQKAFTMTGLNAEQGRGERICENLFENQSGNEHSLRGEKKTNIISLHRYRTFFKPKYKIGYKTVTELEWRCCPGFSGEACQEGPTGLPELIPSHPGPRKGYFVMLPLGCESPDLHGERIDRVEDEMRRLSQSFERLQSMVSGISDSLRLSIQEDTNKMIVSLLNNLKYPDGAVGFGYISHGLESIGKGEVTYPPAMGDLMAKVTEVKEVLKTKSDLLDEVHGMVIDHNGQLRQLLETKIPSPLATVDLLDDYIETKLTKLRADLLDGFENKLTDVQNICDYKVQLIQQQCEEQKNTNQRLEETLDGKETNLKKDLSNLQTQIEGLTLSGDCCDTVNYLSERINGLEKNLHGISDYQRTLTTRFDSELPQFANIQVENVYDSRLEDIETKINQTERIVEENCLHIEDNMRGIFGTEMDGIKTLLYNKMKTLEDKFTIIVEELSNATVPATIDGEVIPMLETELMTIRNQANEGLGHLEGRLLALENLCSAGCSSVTDSIDTLQTDLDNCRKHYEDLVTKLDKNSGLLKTLNSSMYEIHRRITEEEDSSAVQGEITLLKINIHSVNRSLKGLKDSVNKYADEVVAANSTWEDHERKLTDEVHLIQRLVNNQGSQLMFNDKRVRDLKGDLQRINSRIISDLQNCKHNAHDIQMEVSQVDKRVSEMQSLCSKLSAVSGSLDFIKDGLDKHVGDVWNYLEQMNETLMAHTQEIIGLKDKSKITDDHEQGALDATLPPPSGTPSHSPTTLPPPRHISRPSSSTVHSITPLPTLPSTLPNPDPQLGPKTLKGQVAFSAGLTEKPPAADIGVVRFNKILINEGGHYEARTGIFTVPYSGQYLITSVLTPQRNERIEAVLTVSNVSIAQVDTAGYRTELLEIGMDRIEHHPGGGPAVFSLILRLRAGDEVSVVVTSGSLAYAETEELYSTFSGVLLHQSLVHS
uniref:Elastin microfibril interfacer 3 n=1 Tax=Callorhinchus milii TaxID=7868 RepID=A0A4W3J360_CALMI